MKAIYTDFAVPRSGRWKARVVKLNDDGTASVRVPRYGATFVNVSRGYGAGQWAPLKVKSDGQSS